MRPLFFTAWARRYTSGLLCVIVMALSVGLAPIAQAQIITNTATMLYSPAANAANVQLQASVNLRALGGRFDRATLLINATPSSTCMVGGAVSGLTITAGNTGINPLTQGVVELLPPTNGTLSAQNIAGKYTVVPLFNGGLRFMLSQPLPIGANIVLTASLHLNNPLPAGAQVIQATFNANGITGVAAQSNTFIVQGRTLSRIQFMQLDTQTQQLQAARVYHAGEAIWLRVQDGDQNTDVYTVQTVSITLTDNLTTDNEAMILTETGINTGIFTAQIPSVVGVVVVNNDGKISVSGASKLNAKYTDRCDGSDTTAAATLVDPFGLLFNTSDGTPVDGAMITIIDTATGLPAMIFGDDGISAYPATLTTGGSATDAGGTVYTFPPGGYRFPFAMPGSYTFLIQQPIGFSFPTVLSNAAIQTIPNAPFALTVGSRGELFRINPGPALHIDIPLDPKGSALFVRKTASARQVAIGDFVPYSIQVENTNMNFPATTVRVQDHLPQGFQYQQGSTVIDGYSVADPVISSDGRVLQFDIYSIVRGATARINYVLQVGAGTAFGEATNQANATGISIGRPVGSNTALATVSVGDDLMAAKTLIVGRVFIDNNDNGFNEPDEAGLANVRIYMQDGTYVITDKDGQYHIEDINPGTHLLQMDTVPERYTPAPLPNTRFAGNRVSQFVDARAGALVRANFRVLHTPPPNTPVHISQILSQQGDDVWVDLSIEHNGSVLLKKYLAVYSPPNGWQIDQKNSTLNGEKHAPDASMIGYLWQLPSAKKKQHIRLRLLPLATRKNGDKESVAYVRFSSAATPKGRTDMTRVTLHDTVNEVDSSSVVDKKMAQHISFSLVKTDDAAEGKAIGSWDDTKKKHQIATSTVAPPKEKNKDGILSFIEGQGLPHRINAVRLQLDTRLKLKLLVDGKQVPNDRIGFKSISPDTNKTLYTFIGVDLGDPGSHVLRLEGLGPFGNARFKQDLHYIRTGEVAAIRFLELGKNIADGKTPVRVRVQLLDDNGEIIKARTEVEFRGGDLLPNPRSELYQSAEAANIAVAKTVMVEQDGWMSFKPTGISGTHRIDIGYNNVQRSIEVFVAPEYRDWILVGLAEGKAGWQKLAGHVVAVDKQVSADRYYRDGKLAFFAKGRIKGEYLLTMAYDSSKTDGSNRNRLQQYINPTQYYSLYGDVTQRQSDAASKKKLYLKLERNTFYAMFGDYNTGLSITELGRYVRSMNGIKSEFKGTKYGYTGFASRTSQSYIKDELRGNGTSGLYRLSRQNIISGSEKLLVETRDRFQSEVVINSVKMQRFVDYDIDYLAGTLYFKAPINSRDFAMNPIYIQVEYESNDRTDQFVNAGGRIYSKPLAGLEIGSTYVQEGQLYHNNRVMAADATLELGSSTEIKAELARSSNGATPTSVVQANGYSLKLTHLGKKISSKAYARQLQRGFGIGQQKGSEDGTRKFGGDVRYKFNDQWSLSTSAARQQALNTGNTHDALNNTLAWQFKEHSVKAGISMAKDKLATGQSNLSRLFTSSATTRIGNRLTVQASREQALGGGTNAVDFPTRTRAGATYMLSEKISLDVTQEWTQGRLQNASTTRVGLKSSPWTGGQLLTRYEQSLAENGIRSFANIGLKQQWTLNDKWQLDIGLDRVQTLKHPGAAAINPNVPLASGGGNDFNAISLGANYAPKGWRWTNRVEHRVSKTTRSWSVSSGVQGKPKDALSLSFSTQATHSRAVLGTFQTSAATSLGLAWRPNYDGLILLDRLDVRYTASDNGSLKQLGWNYINNMHANWQYNEQHQLEFHHGIKWTRQNLNQKSYAGITDFIFSRWRYDFTEDWDVSLQGGLMHGWQNGQFLSSFGAAVGYNVMDDMWLSIGFNGNGFNARDFATAGYTTRGVYVDFRMKLDQNNILRWLGGNTTRSK